MNTETNKTIHTTYLEDVEVRKYIKTHVPDQEKSKWTREATRAKMEAEKKAKKK